MSQGASESWEQNNRTYGRYFDAIIKSMAQEQSQLATIREKVAENIGKKIAAATGLTIEEIRRKFGAMRLLEGTAPMGECESFDTADHLIFQLIQRMFMWWEEVEKYRSVRAEVLSAWGREDEKPFDTQERLLKWMRGKATEAMGMDEEQLAETFGGWHVLMGSTPTREDQRVFDTEDEIILSLLEEALQLQRADLQ